MYVTLTLCILLFLVVWTYLTDSRPPLFGVYTQPSRLHCLKKAVFRWILTRRKRHGLKCRVNGQSAGYGVRSSDSVQDMDKPQPLSESHPKVGLTSAGYLYLMFSFFATRNVSTTKINRAIRFLKYSMKKHSFPLCETT